jgi:hypothetical protein
MERKRKRERSETRAARHCLVVSQRLHRLECVVFSNEIDQQQGQVEGLVSARFLLALVFELSDFQHSIDVELVHGLAALEDGSKLLPQIHPLPSPSRHLDPVDAALGHEILFKVVRAATEKKGYPDGKRGGFRLFFPLLLESIPSENAPVGDDREVVRLQTTFLEPLFQIGLDLGPGLGLINQKLSNRIHFRSHQKRVRQR